MITRTESDECGRMRDGWILRYIVRGMNRKPTKLSLRESKS